MDEKLVAREGDVLVVSYPEVKIQVAPFSTVGVGNAIYTRKLLDGEDIQEQYNRIYAFLKTNCEGSAREKVALWSAELARRTADENEERNAHKPPRVAPPPMPAPVGRTVKS